MNENNGNMMGGSLGVGHHDVGCNKNNVESRCHRHKITIVNCYSEIGL